VDLLKEILLIARVIRLANGKMNKPAAKITPREMQRFALLIGSPQ